MTLKDRSIHAFALVGALLMLATPHVTLASLNMSAQPIAIYQNMTTADVYLGHFVDASTNLNRLIAGGTFEASCNSPLTGTITGQRTLSSALVGSVNHLTVTIPEQLPALRKMPGFESVQRGSDLVCTYRWTAKAAEATYAVNIFGAGITIGGEERGDGASVEFHMKKPGDGDGGDRTACIP